MAAIRRVFVTQDALLYGGGQCALQAQPAGMTLAKAGLSRHGLAEAVAMASPQGETPLLAG